MSKYDGVIERAKSGAASPRQAIKAKCLDCCCLDIDEIRHCTVTVCPLWKYRPFQLDAQPLRKPRSTGGFVHSDQQR
jgi:hypothetical protein